MRNRAIYLCIACDEFRLAIEPSNLFLMSSVGESFTWIKHGVHGFVASKLDGFLF